MAYKTNNLVVLKLSKNPNFFEIKQTQEYENFDLLIDPDRGTWVYFQSVHEIGKSREIDHEPNEVIGVYDITDPDQLKTLSTDAIKSRSGE